MHRDDPDRLAQRTAASRRSDRVVRAPRGTTLACRSWLTEAAYRMIQNNLDPEVAEDPKSLVVYGGIGRAARDWASFDAILEALKRLGDDESLLIQSGKPVGVFRTHADAPRVLIANSNLVPRWATWEHFHELDRKGLMMFGQMTAGSWIYIGSQGIVQGTYETFAEAGRQHYGGDLANQWILTAGLGGMGGAQPLAATMAGASMLAIECQPSRIEMRLATRYLDEQAADLDDALARMARYTRERTPRSVGLVGNAAEILPELVPPRRASGHGHRPDLRARPRQRLPARRMDARALGSGARRRLAARRARARRARVLRDARRGDARVPPRRHPDLRLRQQPPPGRARRGRRRRVRLPRLRAGVHPAALLRGQGTVPLGRALRRPGGHREDRPQGEGTLPRRRAPAPLARHGRRAHRLPGPARAHLLARPRRAPRRRPRVQRDGALRRTRRRRSSSAATTSTPARSRVRTARPRRWPTAPTPCPTGRC